MYSASVCTEKILVINALPSPHVSENGLNPNSAVYKPGRILNSGFPLPKTFCKYYKNKM